MIYPIHHPFGGDSCLLHGGKLSLKPTDKAEALKLPSLRLQTQVQINGLLTHPPTILDHWYFCYLFLVN